MPAIIVPDPQVIVAGGSKLLVTDLTSTSLVGGQLAGAVVSLFENNYTPTPSDVLSNYTIPGADWPGYTDLRPITGWNAQRLTSDNRTWIASTVILEYVGPAGAGPTIYGYIVRGAGSGNPLLYAVKFTVGIPVANGGILDLVPTFTLPNQQ